MKVQKLRLRTLYHKGLKNLDYEKGGALHV